MNEPGHAPAPPKRNREVDFGVHWHLCSEPHGFPWRVSWSEAEGEIYAVELLIFEHGRRLSLAKAASREEAERILAGWADRPTTIGPLANRHFFAQRT
ncbi:hypothetical protein [Oceanithermus sp.]|uniref:hypothetical protein n=1 Tax=Oceanithermus sp. TaxID=2268145 RepID=UPI00257EE224|nr:hypothetical protein [Oceanithermus sp.]